MSAPRPAMVMGTETEYGMLVRGPWDSEFESYDAAATQAANTLIKTMRTDPVAMGRQLIIGLSSVGNGWQHLANGSRFYLDGRHPEMSIPECWTPREAVIWDVAGERLMASAMTTYNEQHPWRVDVHKRNTDSAGHTWGCHENFCISPSLFARLCTEERRVAEQKTLATFLAVRPLLTGSGKVGYVRGGHRCAFQLTQRADFIERFRSGSTTQERPLIQTRNSPLAGSRWSRFHVICGDANCMQWPTYLKLALTALMLLLWMDRDGRPLPRLPVLDDDYPRIARMVSWDPEFECVYPVRMYEGSSTLGTKRKMKAIDILSYYVDALATYTQERSWALDEEAASYREAVRMASDAMAHLRAGAWKRLYGILEWPTKRVVVEEYLQRKKRGWQDVLTDPKFASRVRTLANMSFTTLDQSQSILARLAAAGHIRTVARASEVGRSVSTPPRGRAHQRSMLAGVYAKWGWGVDWEKVQLLQQQYEITAHLFDPVGVASDAPLQTLVQQCPEPIDLYERLRREPINGMTVNCQLRNGNA